MIIQSNPYKGGFFEQNSRKSSSVSSSKNSKSAENVTFSGGLFKLSESAKKNIYTSSLFKKFAKMTANPVLLEATAVLGLACLLRPLTILSIPGAEKRDKQYASAHSIVTGLWTYGTTLLLYNPINKAVKNVSKRLKEDPNYLKDSFIRKNEKTKEAFEFVANTLPRIMIHPILGIGIIALLPVAMKVLFPQKPKNEEKPKPPSRIVQNKLYLQFRGKAPSSEKPLNFFEKITKNIEQKIEKHVIEKFAYSKHIERYSQKMAKSSETKSSILKQIINTTTGLLGTLVYIGATMLNPKIEEDRKKTLSTNYFITWGLSAVGAIGLNKGVMKTFGKISDNYKKYNIQEIEENFAKKLATNPHKAKELLAEKTKELEKIEFFRGKMRENAATMICYAVMYRYITPVLATPLAELSKKIFPHTPKESQDIKQKLSKT